MLPLCGSYGGLVSNQGCVRWMLGVGRGQSRELWPNSLGRLDAW